MENASKALIIAGAILLSILIISLGIIVYNQAKGTVGNVNLSEYQIQVFNDKFTPYEGRNVSGKQVNNLIKSVIESNRINIKDRTGMYITLFYPSDIDIGHYACGWVLDVSGELAMLYSKGTTRKEEIRKEALEQETAWFGGEKEFSEATNWSKEPTHSLKMQDNSQYQVIMTKDERTGLIGTIVISKPGVNF